jgi:hypothetical protein
MFANKSIREFLSSPPVEQYGDGVDDFGVWYDWFCTDKQTKRRGSALVTKLKTIVNSSKIDLDNHYVWFKNNCPCWGELYDDFRIADRETGDIVFTIIPKIGHNTDHGKSAVYGPSNDFEAPLVIGTWDEVKAWFLT